MAILITLTVQAMMPFPRGDLTYSFTVVEIRNNTLVPDNVRVFKNATVVWVNHDPQERYLFIGNERMPVLKYGDTYTRNFHEFGIYDCLCGDNASSRGIVIVR
ncbi:hypothetical protein [Methanocella sp. MCL-LM]|uniref:hypothetical protein n=1 Tax=Methanocella sp. MCL-LM TaxID=3412035 RepID=UPI003C7079FC